MRESEDYTPWFKEEKWGSIFVPLWLQRERERERESNRHNIFFFFLIVAGHLPHAYNLRAPHSQECLETYF
jgi:hypothetical protein